MNRSIRTTGLAGLAAAALLLGTAACSSDDETSTEDAPTTVAPTTTAAEDMPSEEPASDDMSSMTVVEIAASDPQFSTLVELVTAAGLAETLSGEGPFTVLAPTNDAFAAVPKETMDALAADPALLTKVLTYHVVPAEALAADVVTMTEAPTVEGQPITIAVEGESVVLNGGQATVTKTDIVGSNGVIHVIDGVLLPPDMAG